MSVCSRCGQPLPEADQCAVQTAEHLLSIMRSDRRTQVYKADRGGTWHLTYRRGSVAPQAVKQLLAQDAIVRTYSNLDGSFGLGPTWDYEATMAARKAHGKTANVFVPGSERP